MRPVRVAWSSLPAPFRFAFAHASATRRQAENLIVRVEDADGRVGVGEGCPRSYVSGETAASAACAVQGWRGAILSLDGPDDLRDWLDRTRGEVDASPSAACAVELALLDLFARQAECPVEDLLGLPRLGAPLPVTAVYGATPFPLFLLQHLRFSRARMSDAKLKLTDDPRSNRRRAALLARHGDVRLDANNLWSGAEAALRALDGVASHAWAIEEPLAPRDWPGLARVGREASLAIVLDESFGAVGDLDRLQPGPTYFVNLRLSRLGGLLRTLAAAQAARTRGVGLILGAHVGETSILARAALAAAGAVGEALRGYEGAYGTWLLTHDPATPSLTFGRDGRIVPGREWIPAAPGWGLSLEPTDWRDT